ncbi:S-adenosylmethionine-dependent methyltransferase [Saccharomycopsis crataegensis]|uniref:Trimethylguanosine synthase n=1 Tax=Saccharomycopsis crataegensis TaxID=43959 RepID=A0AAV5QU09_9ASCO|nr:S-adenosylmethionine-dependent methyltransferase [Saccharomycopsis crataegensis]
MPRIPPSVFRQALRTDPLLVPLLPVTRSLSGAQAELRWLRKEVPKPKLPWAIVQRSNYRPLQYILGDQPFLDLSIKCAEGTLIPRWETEEWIARIKPFISNVKIIDACTGTGCVALSFNGTGSNIVGIDIDTSCLSLAKFNQQSNRCDDIVHWAQCDILNWTDDLHHVCKGVNFLVSNPPYIPWEEYTKLDRSVKNFEPQLALVGDLEFYNALVHNLLEPNLNTCDGFVFEVGNVNQIHHVRDLVKKHGWNVGYLMDSAGYHRCVVGWKPDGRFDFKKLCDFVY